jgi:hypothetical protein
MSCRAPLENKPSGPAAQELDEAKRVLEEEAALATKVHRMETLKNRASHHFL